MENKLKDVSLNGRLGYLIMCCEAYLKTKYPERDWTFVAESHNQHILIISMKKTEKQK